MCTQAENLGILSKQRRILSVTVCPLCQSCQVASWASFVLMVAGYISWLILDISRVAVIVKNSYLVHSFVSTHAPVMQTNRSKKQNIYIYKKKAITAPFGRYLRMHYFGRNHCLWLGNSAPWEVLCQLTVATKCTNLAFTQRRSLCCHIRAGVPRAFITRRKWHSAYLFLCLWSSSDAWWLCEDKSDAGVGDERDGTWASSGL